MMAITFNKLFLGKRLGRSKVIHCGEHHWIPKPIMYIETNTELYDYDIQVFPYDFLKIKKDLIHRDDRKLVRILLG